MSKLKVTGNVARVLLGIDETSNTNRPELERNLFSTSKYTKGEAMNLIKKNKVEMKEKQRTSPLTDINSIIAYLNPTAKEMSSKGKTADKLRALAPEVEQAKVLVSSAIMSPNDLQVGQFNFTFDNVPGLEADQELLLGVQTIYEEHFNNVLNLPTKVYNWIGEAMYRSGAKPIFILPNATLEAVKRRTPTDAKYGFYGRDGETPGLASFSEYSNMLDDKEYVYSNLNMSFKQFVDAECTDVVAKKQFNKLFNLDILTDPNVTEASMESMVVSFNRELKEGEAIRVTENPDILTFHYTNQQRRFGANADKLIAKLNKGYPLEQGLPLESNPDGIDHFGHPVLMELPPESVVPICIPGAPDNHVGYFILLDANGRPLTIEDPLPIAEDVPGPMDSPDASYHAMYGSQSYLMEDDIRSDVQAKMAFTVFNKLMDKYLAKRVKGIVGPEDVEISRINAITTVMFNRLMEHKETTVLYCPPELITYFAFNYNDNGTGRSKIEDIQFLLSLRTNLLIAQIMGALNDAVDTKKLEFSAGEENANIEETISLLHQLYGNKARSIGSLDPHEIADELQGNSIMIVPKGIRGMNDLSIDVIGGAGAQATKPDDALIEQINNLMISQLDVLPAALNQLNEPEFARSLTTYNLFFAKKIAQYQDVVCDMVSRLVRYYTTFSPLFKKSLLAKVNELMKFKQDDSDNSDIPEEAKKLMSNDPNRYEKRATALAETIIRSVHVKLPRPDLVVAKSQFEEIRNHLNNVTEVVNLIYPQEIIPSDDQLAANGLTMFRAMALRNAVLQLIKDTGTFKVFNLDSVDQVDSVEVTDIIQTFQNLGKKLQDQRESIAFENQDSGYGGDSYGGGDDYGVGDDYGSDDFGGGDEGGGEGPSGSFDFNAPADDTGGGEEGEEGGGEQPSEGPSGSFNFNAPEMSMTKLYHKLSNNDKK